MPSSGKRTVAVNRLLIEREGVYARVHQIEASINSLLTDTAYPFPLPGVVPISLQKKRPSKKSTVKIPTKPIKLRRLTDGEVAYAIKYTTRRDGQKSITLLDTVTAQEFVHSSGDSQNIEQVATVDIDSEPVEILYQQPASSKPGR